MSKHEVRTPGKVRAIFCNLIEPHKFKDERTGKEVGEPKYDITLSLTPEDMKPLYATAIAAANEAWPGQDFSKGYAFPFKRTEREAEKKRAKLAKKGKSEADIVKQLEIYEPGHFLLTARSNFPVTLSYVNGGKVVAIPTDDRALHKDKFYNGCYVVAILEFVTYPPKKDGDQPGVSCYLKQVFFHSHGKRIGGEADVSVFNDYIGQSSQEDPTGGARAGDGLPF